MKPRYKEADAKLNRKWNVRTANDPEVDTNDKFVQSRSEELRGLIANGTFEVVSREQFSMETRVFGSRFTDEIKHANEGVRLKSRLVAQNYGDKDASTIATTAPTLQRFTKRQTISLPSSLLELNARTRNVMQVYIRSKSPLERDV